MEVSDFLTGNNYLKRLDQIGFDSTRLQPESGHIQYDTWTTVLELTGSYIIDNLAVGGTNTVSQSEHVKVKWFIDGVEMVPRSIDTQVLTPVIGASGAASTSLAKPQLLDGAREFCKSSFVCQVYVPSVANYGVHVLARYSRVEKAKL